MWIRQFFTCSRYSSVLHDLLHSQSQILGFHISFLQEPQSSYSLHSQWHSSWLHFCFKLHTLSFNPRLHAQDPCWTRNYVSFIHSIKLNTFIFIYFAVFGADTQAYGSSIVLQLPWLLSTLTVNW